MIKTAVDAYGTLDVLVNNAGIMDHFAPVAEVDNAMWEKVMKVNLDGPFKAMRSALKTFLEKNSGNIINISSVGGLKGGVAGAVYTTSKHGLMGLTKNTGYMYSKTGIRCNGIAPGAVSTSIGDTIDFTKVKPLVNDRIMTGMTLNPRTGEPSEIAKAALFRLVMIQVLLMVQFWLWMAAGVPVNNYSVQSTYYFYFKKSFPIER